MEKETRILLHCIHPVLVEVRQTEKTTPGHKLVAHWWDHHQEAGLHISHATRTSQSQQSITAVTAVEERERGCKLAKQRPKFTNNAPTHGEIFLPPASLVRLSPPPSPFYPAFSHPPLNGDSRNTQAWSQSASSRERRRHGVIANQEMCRE